MLGRTVILVSHHVQLCAPGANYVVVLDNGRVEFEGSRDAFQDSGIMSRLVQTVEKDLVEEKEKEDDEVEATLSKEGDTSLEEVEADSETSSTVASTPLVVKIERKPPRKLVEEETRAVGRINRDIWVTYISACGGSWYWVVFLTVLVVASISPVLENGWLR